VYILKRFNYFLEGRKEIGGGERETVKEAYILFLLALMTYQNRRRVVNQDHDGGVLFYLGERER
jgi:hypothetical protein